MSDPLHRIAHAILGTDQELIDGYIQSPTFKATLDSLANMLPEMARGLLHKCQEQDAKLDLYLREIMRTTQIRFHRPDGTEVTF